MAGMFCIILFLIDRDDWWSKLAEVLVGFKDSIILNPPTEHIFQSTISVVIFGIYVESVLDRYYLSTIAGWMKRIFEHMSVLILRCSACSTYFTMKT